MSEENKTNSGAPSSDTTSALFVSARKKQLEQQEAERRAKEKEDERLKAEAEVRRLEAEVAERKRRAEDEARRVAQEEEQRRVEAEERRRRAAAEAETEDRRQAAEAEARRKEAQRQAAEAEARRKETQKTQAAGQPAGKAFSMPKLALHKETSGGVQKKPLLPIIIAGAAALVLIVVLVLVLVPRGNKDNPADQTGAGIGDYASLLVDTYGNWYHNGDLSSFCFTTDGDGSWEMYDGEGYLSTYGYFIVEDDGTIWADSEDEEAYTALIEFVDENCFYIEDAVFYSEAFSADAGQYDEDDYDGYSESALYVDPDEAFNNSEVIDGLGMLVRFPDTVFQMESVSEGRLVLSSLDGAAFIEASKGDSYSEVTQEDMEYYRDKKLDKLSTSLPGEITLLDSGFYNSESGLPFVYFKLSYAGTYETRYVCFIAALWQNERTGAKSFYDFVLDCPEEVTDDYMALFNRIRSSTGDA